MVGRFGKKIGKIGKNVVGKAVDTVGDVTEKAVDATGKVADVGQNVVGKAADTVGDVAGKIGDINEAALDKAFDSKFAELFKKQSNVLLTADYFDKFHFDAKAETFSPYNAYSLGLACFLAYSVKGNGNQGSNLQLNKEAFKKKLRKEDQENNPETEAIYEKLDNWLSNFKERYFITGRETSFFKLSR